MFILGKIFWIVAAPGNLLLLLILVGLVRLAGSRRRRGFAWVVVGAAGLAATALLPVGSWLLLPLENRFPLPTALPAKVDGVVLLGGGVDESISAARAHATVNHAADRLVSTAELARRYPEARIVVDSGSGGFLPGSSSESETMKAFLIDEGVAADRIVEEPRSRNTHENAVFAFEEVKPQPGETWILVTSAWHMPRAIGCFRRAGWSATPYPVDFKTSGRLLERTEVVLGPQLFLLTLAMKEWVGLVAYRVLGYTDALFPG
jgi:uncharacterized SAM-binding protein YcdF (DUF218 family)